jgi:hypothetical protein
MDVQNCGSLRLLSTCRSGESQNARGVWDALSGHVRQLTGVTVGIARQVTVMVLLMHHSGN